MVPEDEEIDDHYEESVWWSCEDYDDQEACYSCDTCERDFFTQEQYDQHMSEHQTCNLDGCKFTAHEKIVAKHIEMQHATGKFYDCNIIELLWYFFQVCLIKSS